MTVGREGNLRIGSPAARERAAAGTRSSAPAVAGSRSRAGSLSPWFAGTVLTGACGVLLVAVAYALSRSGRGGGEPLYWLGLAGIMAPAAVAVASRGLRRAERIGIVLISALLLYGVKLLLEPFALLFSDELVHSRNAADAIAGGALFTQNTILPVTERYPGLAAATSAVASVTGLGVLGAAVLVIAGARVVITISLYLLLEWAGGSQRVAALGTVLYAASPNYVYWGAQYSYQSLALPLALAAGLAVLRRMRSTPGSPERRTWTVVACAAMATVTVTHHLTGVVLAAFVGLVAVAHRITTPWEVRVLPPAADAPPRVVVRPRRGAPWLLALVAAGLPILWVVLVAPRSLDYLGDIFGRAFGGVGETVVGASDARRPFEAASGSGPAAWERVVGIAAAGISAVCVLLGVLRAWRRGPRNPLVAVLVVAAAVWVALLPLRLVPAAWETANRSSDVLYIGVASLTAAAIVPLIRRGPAGRAAIGAMAAVLVVGGVLTSWPPDLRLAQPYRVTTPAGTLEPQGRELARWARAELPPGERFAADESNARLLLAFAGQDPSITRVGSVDQLIGEPELTDNQRFSLRVADLRWVVIDRRERAGKNMTGYFFPNSGAAEVSIPPRVRTKWDRAGADRVYDTGDIVVYDAARLAP